MTNEKTEKTFANKSAIKNLYSKKMFGLAVAGAGFAALSQQVQAQVIIEDNFTYAGTHSDYAQLSSQGGDPSGGLPTDMTSPVGATWQGLAQADGYDTNESYPSGVGHGNVYNGNGAAMTLGGSSASNLEYSITFAQTDPQGRTTVGQPNYNPTDVQYSYLGFYSTVPSGIYGASGDTAFAGLVMDQNGNLYTDVAGSLSAPEAFTGAFVLGNSYTLTYDLNTSTGALSNISLTGSTTSYSFSPLGAVTDTYAGFADNQEDTQISATHFEVSALTAAPEPSTYALLAGGALVLGAYQYRRRQQHGI